MKVVVPVGGGERGRHGAVTRSAKKREVTAAGQLYGGRKDEPRKGNHALRC